MIDRPAVPNGGADELLAWFECHLAALFPAAGYWLSCHAPGREAAKPTPSWYPQVRDPGQCWRLAIGQDLELVLALAEPPPQSTRQLLEPLLALLADALRRSSDAEAPCCQALRSRQQMLDAINNSVIGMNLDGFITSWNRGAEQMFGYSKDEALGRHVLFLYADEAEDDSLLAEAFDSGSSREMLVRRKRRDGAVFWASINLTLLVDEEGQPEGLLGYLSDATERIQAEEKLRLQSAIFEYSDEAIMVTDVQGRIVSVNRAFSRLFGVGAEDLIGGDHSFLHCRQHGAEFWDKLRREAVLNDHWIGEILCSRQDGSSFPSWLSLSSVRNIEGHLTHYVAMLTDVTERQQAEKKIYQLAYFDTLTGLPNRSMLGVLLSQALEEAKRAQSHGALLLINIDRFKRVNDALGVAAGDELLVQLAARIRSTLRAEDVVARCGPDEFVIALFDITRRDHASIVAEKVLERLNEPVTLALQQERFVQVTATIGIVVFPNDGAEPQTLLRNASIALTRLRQSPDLDKRYLFFASDMNQRARERHQIEEDLRQALEGRELMLYFQPQFDLVNGTMPSAEVLLRWKHHTHGMIPPGKFIPVAEETGLIHELGDWVLECACRTLSRWIQRGLEPVRLAVNLSARQFRPKLQPRITQLLRQYRVPARLLELEITESLLMQNEEMVVTLLDHLHRLGLMIALDDFGTGYSSLGYLRRLPIDTLKIDRSFIHDLPGGSQESTLVLSIIRLAQNHGLSVVAEGVETEEQLEFLRLHGCPVVQGFLLARPMPLDDFEPMLSGRLAALRA